MCPRSPWEVLCLFISSVEMVSWVLACELYMLHGFYHLFFIYIYIIGDWAPGLMNVRQVGKYSTTKLYTYAIASFLFYCKINYIVLGQLFTYEFRDLFYLSMNSLIRQSLCTSFVAIVHSVSSSDHASSSLKDLCKDSKARCSNTRKVWDLTLCIGRYAM